MECACELERPIEIERERDTYIYIERGGRGTNKVFVSDACDRIEDCQREREREREQESGRGGVTFYASKTDINHVSI